MWALSQEHMGERICTEISLRVKYIPIEKAVVQLMEICQNIILYICGRSRMV